MGICLNKDLNIFKLLDFADVNIDEFCWNMSICLNKNIIISC